MEHPMPLHQYIDRSTGRVKTEQLFFDRTIQAIYSTVREKAPFLFDLLLTARTSRLLGCLNYDFPLKGGAGTVRQLLYRLNVNENEICGSLDTLDSYRKIFERRINYWQCRPMDKALSAVVSPADARVLTGSFADGSPLFIKEKFFDYTELIAPDRPRWLAAFLHGDYAIFRLTPDKYHYNHTPVAGKVAEWYEIDGRFHSCNPGAVVRAVSPYSRNRRVVTILDTDVPGGSGVGLVAMVEIVALMIGRICQCYSRSRYHEPRPLTRGMFIEKGQPKSLFRPGSSTLVLLFQKDRINFDRDLAENSRRKDVHSRFSRGFGQPLVETDVKVRETIARRR